MLGGLMPAGCAGLPSSGPTGAVIRKGASAEQAPFAYTLVEVVDASALPAAAPSVVTTLPVALRRPTDLLGPGDVINVTVYEAGVTLFGGSALAGAAGAGSTIGLDPRSSAERLPTMRIDDSGYIRVPFVGRVRAAGRTVAELQSAIQEGLRGKSQSPQVLVAIQESLSNSVILAGEVARPGRLVLATNRESLVDAIALGGGYKGQAKDAVARVERDGGSFEVRLSELLDLPEEDVRVAPGDRITVVSRPQSFSVLGAANRAEEISFPRSNLSLAQAVALSGGSNPNQGDPSAIYVFRFVPGPDGREQPTVYNLNMMRPGAYLLSQRFMMRDRDLLFVGNARANQVTKFVQLVSQLFVPVATVGSTVSVVR
ncbi:polysaccharide export protein [Sphingomonas sp. BN140010]|uniref:Polysaccharide export protein n=1 Tax=Sphingomonas arvum TaxID=2992113 RepID=A0ABT3JD05_9SPHN|nr:polysaccharide biosynthesis/export family protein [Sphingomonas sp. BN140010]MCW3796676.1 polysaccharide export protein [Sphingomonas sp. BN140010]